MQLKYINIFIFLAPQSAVNSDKSCPVALGLQQQRLESQGQLAVVGISMARSSGK
jgi:hypothetical protein